MKTIAAFSGLFFLSLSVLHYGINLGYRADQFLFLRSVAGIEHLVGVVAAKWGYEKPAVFEPELSDDEQLCFTASLYGQSCDLWRAIRHVESRGNSYAVSPVQAIGLLQLMPDTVKKCGITEPSRAFVPKENIECGVWWMSKINEEERGDLFNSLGHWNGGIQWKDKPAAVQFARDVLNELVPGVKHDRSRKKETKASRAH